MQFETNQRVLWLSQVRSIPFRERVELAGRYGYGWISTLPADYRATRQGGLSDADMRAIAEDNGVRLSYLDPLTLWVPDGLPKEGSPELIAYLDTPVDEFLAIAGNLGVDRLHLIGSFPEGRYSLDELIDYYGKTCERAAENGLKCLIEAIPLWGLRKFDDVLTIVKEANQPNSGIIFDTWHYTRAGQTIACCETFRWACLIPSR